MARQVETRGAARTMAEVRRRELIDKVHGEGKSMNLLRVSAADPVMTPLDTRQVYLGNCLGPHLYAAASEVRGLSELADAMQRDAGRIIMRLPSRQHGRFAAGSPRRLRGSGEGNFALFSARTPCPMRLRPSSGLQVLSKGRGGGER